MVRKSLHNEEDFEEVLKRLNLLNETSLRKWGRMSSAQMLVHCDRVLQVATGKIILPEIHPFLRLIGIVTKKEMWLFNNGIPPDMPTFRTVKCNERYDFEVSRKDLLNTLNEFCVVSSSGKLPVRHPLFGEMRYEDWGFLEYKHLNHHLKQFGL